VLAVKIFISTDNNGKIFASYTKTNFMKINLLFIALLILSISVKAQTVEKIKKNPDYIWGEASASTLEQADQFAMKDLISQISVKIESSFSNVLTETESDIKEYTRSVINTYSNIYLNNAKRIVVNKKKSVYVLRYMNKKDIDEMFENRKAKIYDYVNLAILAEQDLRIADALRYYYWAMILLTSHPEGSKMKYTTQANIEISLLPFIQSEFDKIFQNLRISVTDTLQVANAKSLILSVQYRSKPVTNLDYVYWYGDGFSNLYSAKDGLGIVDFYSGQIDNFSEIKLKIEYVYESRSIIDPDVQSVLQMSVLPRLKEAEITVPLYKSQKLSESKEESLPPKIEEPEYKADKKMVELFDKVLIDSVIDQISLAVLKKESTNINNLFTESGLKSYNKLLNYGNAKILSDNNDIEYIYINGLIMVRSVPMSFSFPNNNRTFVEDVVFIFDSTGKVDNINFALNDIAINDIMCMGERFGTDEEKFFLINFLECYKTAYSLENIEFIESVFSDDALIIVGTLLKQSEPIDDMYLMLDNKNIKYQQFSKKQYVEHLNKAFASKEYINLQFEDNEIRRSGANGKIYGIQICQNYYSSNYSDKGYLFLMIDLEDSINPKIYVRTWQPEKNPDGSVIGLEHFSLN